MNLPMLSLIATHDNNLTSLLRVEVSVMRSETFLAKDPPWCMVFRMYLVVTAVIGTQTFKMLCVSHIHRCRLCHGQMQCVLHARCVPLMNIRRDCPYIVHEVIPNRMT